MNSKQIQERYTLLTWIALAIFWALVAWWLI